MDDSAANALATIRFYISGRWARHTPRSSRRWSWRATGARGRAGYGLGGEEIRHSDAGRSHRIAM